MALSQPCWWERAKHGKLPTNWPTTNGPLQWESKGTNPMPPSPIGYNAILKDHGGEYFLNKALFLGEGVRHFGGLSRSETAPSNSHCSQSATLPRVELPVCFWSPSSSSCRKKQLLTWHSCNYHCHIINHILSHFSIYFRYKIITTSKEDGTFAIVYIKYCLLLGDMKKIWTLHPWWSGEGLPPVPVVSAHFRNVLPNWIISPDWGINKNIFESTKEYIELFCYLLTRVWSLSPFPHTAFIQQLEVAHISQLIFDI